MTPGEEALHEAMRHEQAMIYGHTCPEYRQAEPIAESQLLFARPTDSYYGPAPAPVLAELVEALAGDAPRVRISKSDRRAAEQAIARGFDDEAVAVATNLVPEIVRRVRAAMDRLSA